MADALKLITDSMSYSSLRRQRRQDVRVRRFQEHPHQTPQAGYRYATRAVIRSLVVRLLGQLFWRFLVSVE
jgi:hypothetical protein